MEFSFIWAFEKRFDLLDSLERTEKRMREFGIFVGVFGNRWDGSKKAWEWEVESMSQFEILPLQQVSITWIHSGRVGFLLVVRSLGCGDKDLGGS